MAREITYNNFEISLVVFMPNITTNHAITYTNSRHCLSIVPGDIRVRFFCNAMELQAVAKNSKMLPYCQESKTFFLSIM